MNKIILLLGDLATGKSTYSLMLAKRYNCLVFSKDKIKEYLGDEIGFKNREENKKLSNATFKIMSHIFFEVSKTNQDLILEANFHSDELKQLYDQCIVYGYECLTVVFEADIDILYKRFMNRARNEHRHPVHVTDDLIEYESFKNYILKSRDVLPLGMTIKINANDFSYQNEENYQVFDQFMKYDNNCY